MNEMQDRYYRMLTIVSLLSSEEESFSIQELHELLGIDIQTVRNDIASLYYKDADDLMIVGDDEDGDDDVFMDADPGLVQADIKKGLYDQIPFFIMKESEDSLGKVELVLTESEFEAFKPFYSMFALDSELEISRDNGITLKNMNYHVGAENFFASRQSFIEKTGLILDALAAKTVLKVTYQKRGDILFDVPIYPLEIVFNKDNKQFYLEAVNLIRHNKRYYPERDLAGEQIKHSLYRLDRIIKVSQDFEKEVVPFDEEPTDWSGVWGMEYQEKPVHVKVKVYDEFAVAQRVMRDLGDRAERTMTKYDGYYIYEDDIIGQEKFRAWIRSYGSSVVVLEPREIREKVLESVRERLKMYGADSQNIIN